MIKTIDIKGLRGIREGKLEDLSPLVILVGPNGCGKSTVLHAIQIGASPHLGRSIQESVERNESLKPRPRWLLWRAEETSEVHISVSTDLPESRLVHFHSHGVPGPTHVTLAVAASLVYRGRKLSSDCHGIVHLPRGMVFGQQPDEAATLNLAMESIPSVRAIEAHIRDPQSPLYKVFTDVVEQGRKEAALHIVSGAMPEVIGMEILSESDKPLLYFNHDGFALPADLAGDGVRSLLRMSLELASRQGGVVLLEEPEVHLHPGAIRQSAKAILTAVRRDVQVILSTHSLEVVDAILAESSEEDLERLSLYRMNLEKGVLSSYRLDGQDVALARSDIADDLR